jgi:uncharacterized membrane protein
VAWLGLKIRSQAIQGRFLNFCKLVYLVALLIYVPYTAKMISRHVVIFPLSAFFGISVCYGGTTNENKSTAIPTD